MKEQKSISDLLLKNLSISLHPPAECHASSFSL